MQTGDVVRMSSCETVRRDDEGKAALRLRYKAPKGQDFVFLCLGAQAINEDFNVDARVVLLLRSLGWTVEAPKC